MAVGGDYMRGRFLVAPFLLTQVALFTAVARRRWARLAVVPLGLAGLLALAFGSRIHAGEVVNERAFHPESQIGHIGEGHVRPNRYPGELPPEPTLGARVMASAFTEDPRLRWVDGHGLTDAFIARCPALPRGRAGHVERVIPRAYFEARGDIRLLENGQARLLVGDPTLADEVRALRAGARWPSAELERRYRELRLLTTGPLLDPERLALIPRYAFTRAAIPVGAVTTHQPDP